MQERSHTAAFIKYLSCTFFLDINPYTVCIVLSQPQDQISLNLIQYIHVHRMSHPMALIPLNKTLFV